MSRKKRIAYGAFGGLLCSTAMLWWALQQTKTNYRSSIGHELQPIMKIYEALPESKKTNFQILYPVYFLMGAGIGSLYAETIYRYIKKPK